MQWFVCWGKKENLVYLLWGNPAAAKCTSINMAKNTAIRTSHPSPLGAHKTDKPFMGSKCFSRCNKALEAKGRHQSIGIYEFCYLLNN